MTTTKSYEILNTSWEDPTPEQPRKYPAILSVIQFLFGTIGRISPKTAGKVAYKLFSTPTSRARHKASDEILETAQLFEFMYGRQILKGYEWGKGDKTILLVHGWESRGTGLRTFVPKLVRAGYRVVAFDGPAHGNSSGKQTNLPHFAGAVAAAIHHLGEVYGIITHSFGGATTAFAMAHIDSNISVKKLVFIAVPSKLESVLRTATKQLNLPSNAANAFVDIIQKKLNGIPMAETDVAKIGQKVKAKDVLLVYDKTDPIIRFDNAEAIFNSWNNANLLATEGHGHYRIMKNPDVIDRVCWFVNG
ncbi:MAG: pimeloyl-ACP methyl ester carboxylesterase [Paraglaciecola sp.]|jgi:pimeloyl-ACP methyl ester carboxylesterase